MHDPGVLGAELQTADPEGGLLSVRGRAVRLLQAAPVRLVSVGQTRPGQPGRCLPLLLAVRLGLHFSCGHA